MLKLVKKIRPTNNKATENFEVLSDMSPKRVVGNYNSAFTIQFDVNHS